VQSDSIAAPAPYYDPLVFHNMLDGIDRRRCLIATYYVEDRVAGEDFLDHFSLVQSLALEGSTGTWERIEEDTPEVRARLSGKLVGYYEIPSLESDTKRAVIQLGFPIDAWEPNVPMMLLSVAGNCFAYSPRMRLLDVAVPDELLTQFGGPKFGVPGIRARLGIAQRPLSLHIIKPKMGMTPENTAHQVYQTCLGGVDMVKDDEMCSDVYNSKFEDRLTAVLAAIERAADETGKRPIYFVSITDEVDQIVPKALRAIELGATGLLLTYSAGLSALRALTSHREVQVPVLLHASHMIAAQPRIAWPAFAKLCRLCGADLMLTPTYWSSIPMVSLEEGIRTAQVKLAPWRHIKPTWPMPCAGVYPGLTEILVREYGSDIVIPAGGGMLGHPMGYTAGAKAWQQAIEVVMLGRSLKEAASDYPELHAAVEKWGIPERPRTHWLRADPRFHPKTTRG
jgi:2,3-diketo-5-methylthiopentyl-1-phosphate enolase